MNRRSSLHSRAARAPTFEAVRYKLSRIVSRHEQLKLSYHQLNSQIRTGLFEAEDVIASLAIPLMKLVGLKTAEMAAEGRFSNIVATSVDGSHSQEENDYMTRAIAAGNELMERQKLRLMQLITLLKEIEAQVNASQNSILQNLGNHKSFLRKFFMKAFTCVSAVQQSGQNNDLSQMMLNILKATFDQVGDALGSLETGIDELICELADKMCNPMVEYVNGLKVEMKTGISMKLLEVIKEMDAAINIGKFELEETRKRARLAEQSRTEASSKLQKSEAAARKLTISLGLLIEDAPKSDANSTQQEPSITKEDPTAKDDNLLWDLLRMERKCHEPNNPLEAKELPVSETCKKKLTSARATRSFSHRPVTHSKGANTKSPFIKSRELLCSSSSPTAQKVLSRKRITP